MAKEQHPYLRHFDTSKSWKYLIVGTFPPNKQVREDKKSYADYFYGNKGSFWKIINAIYPEYLIDASEKKDRIAAIQKWQSDYCVGITDTIFECTRRNAESPDDADLIIEWNGYNHNLKNYLVDNISCVEKIIFTSTANSNSAYETFKIILGDMFSSLPQQKMVLDFPSPSGSSNTAMFNVNNNQTLGLHLDLFNYISSERADLIPCFENRWKIKKMKKQETGDKRKAIVVPAAPEGILKDFKIWKYKQILPQTKCV